uniref:Uncharacterized protein n=1 Tax=Anguilla anguilla TaxID=7936 RepID=A0A0E9TDD0_ANGAN
MYIFICSIYKILGSLQLQFILTHVLRNINHNEYAGKFLFFLFLGFAQWKSKC